MCLAALTLALLLPGETRAQQRDAASSNLFGIEPGSHAVGFQLLEEQDPSRVASAGTGSVRHPRPMRIWVWYPAARAAQPMRFGRYLALADGDIWPTTVASGLREKLKFSGQPLARSVGQGAFASLLQRPVLAVENAKPSTGQFPLIVIGQGIWFESPIAFAALAEYLAGRGFVVATIPLVGTASPIVKVDRQDLETEVRDLEFVIARARRLPFVSQDKLGIVGFDLGGMAGLILTMRNRDVDAFVSLGSGILFDHPSGLPKSAADYDPLALRVPWLHITPRFLATQPTDSKVESLFNAAVYSERYLLVPDAMAHGDFTSYALVEGRTAVPVYWAAATPGDAARHKAVSRYVFNFLAACLTQSAESREFVSRAPDESASNVKMTLERRPAARASISYDEFVTAVIAGRAEDAVRDLRSAAATEPNHLLLREDSLSRLVMSLTLTWGLVSEAIPVIEFWVERYPSSAQAHVILAESYILLGNNRAAIDVYNKLLERYPNNANARTRLEWLRSQ
jgi:hypothetical protein